jgi:transcriptional regulator with XRE-family HTH domain
MSGPQLKRSRRKTGLTQALLARKVGVSQGYLSLLERGLRSPSPELARRLCKALRLPATALPLEVDRNHVRRTRPEWVVRRLAQLDYPGYAYLNRSGTQTNPAEVLLRTLAQKRVEPRLLEAMPWLLLNFGRLNHRVLVTGARELGVQNRLGFVVALAKQVAERSPTHAHRLAELESLESSLETHRLANEDLLGQSFRTERLRAWVETNRSREAVHWNLVTSLAPDHLAYAS